MKDAKMKMPASRSSRSFTKVAVGISALLLSVAIHAQARDFNIPGGDLKTALDAYIAETKLQVVYNAADLKGKSTKGVHGAMEADKALDLLLEGTELKLRRDRSGAVIIFFRPGEQAIDPEVTTLDRVEVFANLSHLGDRTRTGTRMDTDPMTIPLTITSVDKDLLKQQQARSLSEALSNVAGVTDSTGSGAYLMRGFAAGAMRNGNLLLNTDGADAPLISVSKIEVVKGPEAIIAGVSAGYGGVINVITKAPEVRPVTEVTASVGSRGYYETGLDVGRPLNDDKSLLGRFIVSKQGAGKTTVGFDGSNSVYVAPSLTWRNKGTGTDVTAQLEYQDRRVPPDATVITNDSKLSDDLKPMRLEPTNDGIQQKRNVATLVWNQRLNEDWSLSVKQSYDELKNDSRVASGFPGNLLGMPASMWISLGAHNGLKYATSSTKIELKTELETGVFRHNVVLAYDRSQSSIRASNQTTFINSVDTATGAMTDLTPVLGPIFGGIPSPVLFNGGDPREQGVLAMDQITWNQWIALVGWRYIRYDGHPWSAKVEQFKRSLPSLGLLYQFSPRLSAYANAAKGFTPNAGNFSISGSPVPPENATQYEIGLKSVSADKKLTSSISTYQIKQDNVAVQDPNNPTGTCAGGGCYISVPGVTAKGVELELSGEVVKGLGIRANYAYASKVSPQSTANLFYAHNQASLWALYRFSGEDAGGFWVSAGLQTRSARVGSDQNLRANPGRTKYDASVGYDRQQWSFVAGVKNITNKRMYPLLGGLLGQAAAVQPREFTLTASYSLN